MRHDAQFVIDFIRSYMDAGVLEFEVIYLELELAAYTIH